MPFGTAPVFSGDGLDVVDLGPPAYEEQTYNGRRYEQRSSGSDICTYACGILAIGSGAACGYGVTNLMLSDEAKGKIDIMLACALADLLSLCMVAIGVLAIGNKMCGEARCCRDTQDDSDDEDEPLLNRIR